MSDLVRNTNCWFSHTQAHLYYVYIFQAGFVIGYVLLFGNEMLLTSFFASSLLTISVSNLLVFKYMHMNTNRDYA